MKCEEVLEWISAQIDQELDASSRVALESHLSQCESCRAVQEAFRSQDAQLCRAFAPQRVAASSITGKVMSQIHREWIPEKTSTLSWVSLFGAAAAGFLLAVSLFSISKTEQRDRSRVQHAFAMGLSQDELRRRVQDLLVHIEQTPAQQLQEEEIRSLGDYSIQPLKKYLQSKHSQEDFDKHSVVARILSEISPPCAIPDLIQFLSDEDGNVRYYAAQGLARLTSCNNGCAPEKWREQPFLACENSYKQWQDWWKNSQSGYACPQPVMASVR